MSRVTKIDSHISISSDDFEIGHTIAADSRIVDFKEQYERVVVTGVDLQMMTISGVDALLICGVFPSLKTRPADAAAAMELPHCESVHTSDVAASTYRFSFHPPGVEYNVAQQALSSGHPIVVCYNCNQVTPTADVPARRLAVIKVTVHLECSGVGFFG